MSNAGEVNNVSGATKQARLRLEVADVALFERQARIIGMMRQIGGAAAAQIVDDPNAKAALEQEIDHVAADEAGAPGNDRNWLLAHAALMAFIVRTLKYRSLVRLSGSFPALNAWHKSRAASSTERLGTKPSTRLIFSELMW